jgi:hypothetical protein
VIIPAAESSRVARHSVYHRSTFASGAYDSRTAHYGSTEKPGTEALRAEQSVLCSPVRVRIIAKYRR